VSASIEEVLALLGARPLVAFEVGLLLARRQHRRLARIEAHGHDIEFLADRLVDHAQRTLEAVEHLRAQHRAFVIHKRKDHGLPPEVIAQLHGLAVLILERQIQRQRLVQTLLERHLL
jgi:hypothetical protein